MALAAEVAAVPSSPAQQAGCTGQPPVEARLELKPCMTMDCKQEEAAGTTELGMNQLHGGGAFRTQKKLAAGRAAHRPVYTFLDAAPTPVRALRSYHAEWTASHQNCEVNRHWAPSVLG